MRNILGLWLLLFLVLLAGCDDDPGVSPGGGDDPVEGQAYLLIPPYYGIAYDALSLDDNTILVAGYGGPVIHQGYDVAVVRLNAEGDTLWSLQIPFDRFTSHIKMYRQLGGDEVYLLAELRRDSQSDPVDNPGYLGVANISIDGELISYEMKDLGLENVYITQSLLATDDGFFAVTPVYRTVERDSLEIVVSKVNHVGDVQWTSTLNNLKLGVPYDACLSGGQVFIMNRYLHSETAIYGALARVTTYGTSTLFLDSVFVDGLMSIAGRPDGGVYLNHVMYSSPCLIGMSQSASGIVENNISLNNFQYIHGIASAPNGDVFGIAHEAVNDTTTAGNSGLVRISSEGTSLWEYSIAASDSVYLYNVVSQINGDAFGIGLAQEHFAVVWVKGGWLE